MKNKLRFAFTAVVCGLTLLAMAQSKTDYNVLIGDIEFQPGVTIDINVNAYVNEGVAKSDAVQIFAIEGMSHTANCWIPFAQELFAQGLQGNAVSEFFAIDMPGRGGSGFPQGFNPVSGTNFKLADMYLEDYLAVIRAAINYLNAMPGVQIEIIMGHSLGGLEVILLQDLLISEGSNIRQEFGIKQAILLAPAIPAPLPWGFLGGGAAQLIPMAMDHPDHGLILNIPYTIWPWLFFTNTCCHFMPGNPWGYPPSMVPGAPTPAQVLANGYNSIEAGPLLFHMAGLPIAILDPDSHHPTLPRVGANPGIFGLQHGVVLTIIAEEFDKMMTPEEEAANYEYLTGDTQAKRLIVILGEDTCHDTHISDPHKLVQALNQLVYPVPLGKWAIYLGLALMFAFLLIRFRRMI